VVTKKSFSQQIEGEEKGGGLEDSSGFGVGSGGRKKAGGRRGGKKRK